MLYIYIIGAAVITGLLIGFVALSIVWISRTVSKRIQERTLDLISSYDELLEERSQRLDMLDAQLLQEETPPPEEAASPAAAAGSEQEVLTPSALLHAVERVSTAPYQLSGMGELYRQIRSNFDLEPEELLELLPIEKKDRSGGPASRLLRELSFETVYQLSTLPGEEQYLILAECIPDELLDTLESCRTPGGFSCLAFYDALRSLAELEPAPIRMRVSESGAHRLYPAYVDVSVDPEICEGILVEADNVLYDYSIKMGEIG